MLHSKITSAAQTDYPIIIEIWEASVRATHFFLNEDDIQAYKKLIYHQYLDQVRLFIIFDQNQPIGFLGLQDNTIQMLFIHPRGIGKGFGKALLLFAIKQNGAMQVDVNEQNNAALQFYQHFGFSATERYDHDDAGKPYPILSLRLK